MKRAGSRTRQRPRVDRRSRHPHSLANPRPAGARSDCARRRNDDPASPALERIPDRIAGNRRIAGRGSAPGQRVAARAGRTRAHHGIFPAQRGKHSAGVSHASAYRVRLRTWGIEPSAVLADLCMGVGGEPGAGGGETGAAAGRVPRRECCTRSARASPSLVERAHKLADSDIGISDGIDVRWQAEGTKRSTRDCSSPDWGF